MKRVAMSAFQDQLPGTSGLRKRVTVFQQAAYLEGFVEAVLQVCPCAGRTLVLGGDGRFLNDAAVDVIVRMAAAHGAAAVVVGQRGILSTPAVSCLIRKRGAYGGLLLTASHNPGGPHGDFGIKFNTENGGPAPESVTNAIFERSKTLTHYDIVEAAAGGAPIDVGSVGRFRVADTLVEVVDSVADYAELMEQLFDFERLRALVAHPRFSVRFDAMNAVTGPYAVRLFCEKLGVPRSSVLRAEPLPDFGGIHPDPNLVYARELVDEVNREHVTLGAASDGDGDRNMIVGADTFVSPSDSVAIIAARYAAVPCLAKGINGVARSMPTSAALDAVAAKMGWQCYEVPTGWKFFGSLMDAGKLSLCGEESFGTSSDHIREKDGIWAVLAWLSIVADANRETPADAAALVSVRDVQMQHWRTYGRHFYGRYDYEAVDAGAAAKMMEAMAAQLAALAGTRLGDFDVSHADNFTYTDPINGSVTRNQGIRVLFSDGSRFVYRLSGTGSVGATIRLYLERYAAPDSGMLDAEPAAVLHGITSAALAFARLHEFTGRDQPDVIT